MKMRKGFTLIELLIVLAIIATLLSVTTPVALNAVKKAKATQVAANLRNIRTAAESYFYVEQEVPTELASLTNSGYLNNVDTGNYTLVSTTTNELGKYKVTVTYTGQDIDPTFVIEVYSDATQTGNDIKVDFYLQSWK